MPYSRRRTGRRARAGTTFRTGAFMPHISKFDQRDIRMEKQGIDIIPRLITQCISTSVANVSGATAITTEADLAFNAQNQLFTNCATFTA